MVFAASLLRLPGCPGWESRRLVSVVQVGCMWRVSREFSEFQVLIYSIADLLDKARKFDSWLNILNISLDRVEAEKLGI